MSKIAIFTHNRLFMPKISAAILLNSGFSVKKCLNPVIKK